MRIPTTIIALLPITIFLAGSLVSAEPLYSESNSEPAPPRSLWCWSSESVKAALADPSARTAFFDFLAAPHGRPEARITSIYLSAGEPEQWPAFLEEAHRRGLTVEFLLGPGGFTRDCAPRLIERVNYIMDYNNSVPPEHRFDGIHFDVEPGRSRTWSNEGLRELFKHARNRVDEYNAENSHQMVVAADIAFWWRDRGPDDVPQYSVAYEFCDYVVCMAYRDTAEAQLEVSLVYGAAQAAHEANRPFWVGCETLHLPGEDHVTYYEEGWLHMEREIAKLPALFRERGLQLAGLVIHHYESYIAMPKKPRANHSDN